MVGVFKGYWAVLWYTEFCTAVHFGLNCGMARDAPQRKIRYTAVLFLLFFVVS